MAKRKAAGSRAALVETHFSRFVLVEIKGKSELAGTGAGRVNIRREEDIRLETLGPGDETPFCRVIVRLGLGFFGRREKEDQDSVSVEGVFEGRFAVHPDVDIETLDSAAADEAFQYGLISQVYPLASSHLRQQLQMMGLSPRNLPLGI